MATLQIGNELHATHLNMDDHVKEVAPSLIGAIETILSPQVNHAERQMAHKVINLNDNATDHVMMNKLLLSQASVDYLNFVNNAQSLLLHCKS